MNENITELPKNLPKPENDGASEHLFGMTIPRIILPSTGEGLFDTSIVNTRYVVLYFFPKMFVPGKNLPLGWDNIPGARGCTPQNIAVNKYAKNLQKYNASIFGITTQPIDELIKLSSLRKFSQSLVSDNSLKFQKKLNIPTFRVKNRLMYRRITLITKKSKIVKVFYPIFPPDKHIFDIINWFEKNSLNN